MAYTEAHHVRHRKSSFRLKSTSTATSVAGYARQLSYPAYENLLRFEPFIRQIVPILIVFFLVMAGTARWAGLVNQSNQIKTSVDAEMHFIAELVQEKLLNTQISDQPNLAAIQAQNLLSDAVSSDYLNHDRQIVLTNSNGKIVASVPVRPELNGSRLDAILGDVTLLTTFGRRAESRLVNTVEGEEAFGVYRILQAPLGGIALIQPTKETYAEWRQDASLGVTLFVGTSLILLVILYA